MTKDEFLGLVLTKYRSVSKSIENFEEEVFEKGFQEYLDSNKQIDFDKLPTEIQKSYMEREELATLISYPLYLYIKESDSDEIQDFKDRLIDENKELVDSVKRYAKGIFSVSPSCKQMADCFADSYGKIHFDKERMDERHFYKSLLDIVTHPANQIRLRPIYMQFAKKDGKIENESEFDDRIYRYYDRTIQELLKKSLDKKPEETLQRLYKSNIEELRESLLVICSRSGFYTNSESFLTKGEKFVAKIVASTTSKNNNYVEAAKAAEAYRENSSYIESLKSIEDDTKNISVKLPQPQSVYLHHLDPREYPLEDDIYLKEIEASREFLQKAKEHYAYFTPAKRGELYRLVETANIKYNDINYENKTFLNMRQSLLNDLGFLRSISKKYPMIFEPVVEELEEVYQRILNAPIPKEYFFSATSTMEIEKLKKYLKQPVADKIDLKTWIETGYAQLVKKFFTLLRKYEEHFQMQDYEIALIDDKLEQLDKFEKEFFNQRRNLSTSKSDRKNRILEMEGIIDDSLDTLVAISGFDREEVKSILKPGVPFAAYTPIREKVLEDPKKDLQMYSKSLLVRYRSEIMQHAKRLVLERNLAKMNVEVKKDATLDELQEKYNELKERQTTPMVSEVVEELRPVEKSDEILKNRSLVELEERRKAILEILNEQAKKKAQEEDTKGAFPTLDSLPLSAPVVAQKIK